MQDYSQLFKNKDESIINETPVVQIQEPPQTAHSKKMSDHKLSGMILETMERLGFISNKQRIKHVLNNLADDINKKHGTPNTKPKCTTPNYDEHAPYGAAP